MTLAEEEPIAVISLHRTGINVCLEHPVGECHVQRHMDQSVLINSTL